MFYKLQILILVCLGNFLQAQDTISVQKDKCGKEYYYDNELKAKVYYINGERLVIMDEMEIELKPKFNNQLDRNYYFFLNKKLERVYPLFLTALEQYRQLQTDIETLKGRERRRFIKAKQKELAQQYEKQLKSLTTSEGQIFTKLMSRATGKTVYEIIKELRGGLSAFVWNIKGGFADIELKKEYNPKKNRDDEYIESLLKSNWRLGYFKPYKGYETFSPK
ncbi:MAG: DUF4294 domain-containing protein [Flavobacteriaceae bacterium]|nr:DUF4294 domain-containing protein [Flavobacteriaceae bacterium]